MDKVEKLREELNFAIENFGMNDLITIMISQKLDKEIVRVQERR